MPTCCNYPYWDYKHWGFRNLSFTLTEPSPPKHNRAWECKTHIQPFFFLSVFWWKAIEWNQGFPLKMSKLLSGNLHKTSAKLIETHYSKMTKMHPRPNTIIWRGWVSTLTVVCIHFRISMVTFKPAAWIWPTHFWTSAKKTTWGWPVSRRQAWFDEVSFALLALFCFYHRNSTWGWSYAPSLLNRLYFRVGMPRIIFLTTLRVKKLVFFL